MMNNKNKKLIILIVIVCIILVFVAAITNHSNKKDNSKENEIIVENNANAEIIEKEDASYEEWLSAAMVSALTLNESDLDIQHIYYKTKTELSNKMKSSGVYVVFKSENKIKCVYSKPLEEENQESGTVNLYTQDLGFSTFESVNINKVNFTGYSEITVDSLTTLISQSMLVSLYEN